AQIGGVHDVDNDVGTLLTDIAAGDALLGREGRHGVGPGQVHRHQLQPTGVELLFDGTFFLVHRHACPVAHSLGAAGEGVVHGGFSAVGIACECNAHGDTSSISQ